MWAFFSSTTTSMCSRVKEPLKRSQRIYKGLQQYKSLKGYNVSNIVSIFKVVLQISSMWQREIRS